MPQTLLHSFKAVIDDIPGTVKGIFVSRSGFQSGAKIYAEANGIHLFQLAKESDDTEISVKISDITTNYVRTALVVDEEWQGESIGQRLLQELTIACYGNYQKIGLEVDKANIGAYRFYTRNGFTEKENRVTKLLMTKLI